jgi:hypothetical protein
MSPLDSALYSTALWRKFSLHEAPRESMMTFRHSLLYPLLLLFSKAGHRWSGRYSKDSIKEEQKASARQQAQGHCHKTRGPRFVLAEALTEGLEVQ